MRATVKLRVIRIEYTGQSVGRDLVFEFQSQGEKLRFAKSIQLSKGEIISQVVDETVVEKDIDLQFIKDTDEDDHIYYRLPVSVTITELDPIYTDTANGSTHIVLDIASSDIQAHVLDVIFTSTRGSDKNRRANFRFFLELELIAVSLIIRVQPPSGKLADYALSGSRTIAYHLDYEGKSNAKADVLSADGTLEYEGTEIAERILLLQSEARNLKGIFFWGCIYGATALVAPQSRIYSDNATGRLDVRRDELSENGNEMVAIIVPIQSVLDFIVVEFHKNLKDPELGTIRIWNSNADAVERDGCNTLVGTELLECRDIYGKHRYPSILRGQAEALWAHKVHKDEGIAGLFQDVIFWGGGEWDYKPRIRAIWGAKQRLGNRADVFYYDMWANFHYGCIGCIGGFRLQRLVSGGNQAQIIDTGSYDPVDDVLTQEGYDLTDFDRPALLSILDRNKDDFLVAARERIWEDPSAREAYMKREFDKRAIPKP